MSGKYKGFWDPSQLYEKGDIVEYYSSQIDDVNAPYAKISSFTYDFDGATIGVSPLLNFQNPQSLSSTSSFEISLSRAVLRSFVSDQGTWNDYKYYQEGTWEGPHGISKFINQQGETITRSEWDALNQNDKDQYSIYLELVNSDYWIENAAQPKTSWSNLSTYDASGQNFNSSSQTTLFEGKYDATETELEDEFTNVQGETDSDAYYISSVQNYKGDFNESENYKQFDIVRSPVSSSFYYARTDVSGAVESSKLIFSDIEIREPSDYTYSSNHIATIEYLGSDESGWMSNGESAIRVGHVLDFSNFNKAINKRRLMVIGVSDDLIWLGSFGEGEKILADYERFTGSVEVTLSAGQVNITNNDSVWSGDQFFFDADYGSSVEFSAFNKKFEHGDGYHSVSPFGVNSLRMRFNLQFSNRSNREANAILHFLENNLGQHERQKPTTQLEYDQGISGFRMDGESLFYPYNTTENLTRRFYCFDFDHQIENEDVHTVNAKIENTTASTLNIAHQIFVKEAPLWDVDETYNQHDVVFCHDNQKYYYSKSKNPQSGNRPWILDEDGATSINRNMWTREFYWSPSVPFDIKHSPSIERYGTAHGPYTQYYPENQQNINMLEMELSFENRSDQEAYAILHFLEMHLGYLSFLFVPPAPYNRKRRFYCENWSHTYVFRNNHTISATFKQFALGQNTPLDDDEIDKIAVKINKKPGRLLASSREMIPVNQNYKQPSSQGFYVKIPVALNNDGETDVFIKNITPASNSVHTNNKFKNLDWGSYKTSISSGLQIGSQTLSSSSDININGNLDDGIVIYNTDSSQYIHTDTGALYLIDGASEPNLLEVAEHPSVIMEKPADDKISPGETYNLFCQFDSRGIVDTLNKSAEENTEIDITYSYAPADEPVFDPAMSYTEGNIIQYYVNSINRNVLYKANKDIAPGNFNASDWDEHVISTSSVLNVVVNPELRDAIKESLTIEIQRPSREGSTIINYDIHNINDSVSILSQKSKNLFFDIVGTVSGNASRLAVPNGVSDIEEILECSTDIEGYLYLGVKYDADNEIYYDYYDSNFVNINTSGNETPELISNEEYNNLSSADKQLYTRSSILDLSSIPLDPSNGGEYVALNIRTGNLILVSENAEIVEGFVTESIESLSEGSINLSEYISSSEKLGGRSLGEIQEINVILKGLFLSNNTKIPAISTGGGYSDEAELNIYIGTEDVPCEIIGKGGQGGAGMMSEGVVYENGQPTQINVDMSPPYHGEDGGDAIYIDDYIGANGVNIYLVNGVVFGGGGGGGGGGYQSDSPRIKNYNFVNMGGGGGGGCGHALGGFPLGERTVSTDATAASGGEPINNTTEYRNVLTKGGAGGIFGQPGEDGGDGGNYNYNRVGRGGLAGKSICWGSNSTPNIYLGQTLTTYKEIGGVRSFYDSSNNPIQDLPLSYSILVAGECLQRLS